MEICRVLLSFGKNAFAKANTRREGFAMVSLLALFPLLATLFVALGAALFVMKRKTLAQAICLQQATKMQEDLKLPLRKLLKLNPRATTLRARRQSADSNVRSATASAYPPAIAIAEAQQAEVILEQTVLQAQQLALLADAQQIREERQRELRDRARHLDAMYVHSQTYYFRPLAVEPKPELDLSPNYETVPLFTEAQQHRFSYDVDLLGHFPQALGIDVQSVQKIACSVSLEERGDDWNLQILAAKAR
jgi:hypothetical protein